MNELAQADNQTHLLVLSSFVFDTVGALGFFEKNDLKLFDRFELRTQACSLQFAHNIK